jgi:glucokinase
LSEHILIGIDIGGTIVRLGTFSPQGRLLGMREAPIEAAQGPQAGLDLIRRMVEAALRDPQMSGSKDRASQPANLTGIGVGCTGPLDPLRGIINNPFTLPTWESVPIVDYLNGCFHVPVKLENDADAAALGEYWQGAGRGVKRLSAITVGTGIGTALILDGHIDRGLDGWHPEGGHMALDPCGPACYCGANGCWEILASGMAIARTAREQVAEQPYRAGGLLKLSGGDPAVITAKLVAQAAEQGDPLARELIERAAYYFSLGVVNLITVLFPEVIVLSGGVMKSAALFMPALEQAIRKHEVMQPAGRVRILPASLGYYAGVYGAAYSVVNP